MTARGEAHGRAKLTDWDVYAIRALMAEDRPPSISRIARAFGVTNGTVRSIRSGENWGWL